MNSPRPTSHSPLYELLAEQRGAVFVEYSVVLITVSLVMALALVALGVPLFSLYSYTEFIVGLPIP